MLWRFQLVFLSEKGTVLKESGTDAAPRSHCCLFGECESNPKWFFRSFEFRVASICWYPKFSQIDWTMISWCRLSPQLLVSRFIWMTIAMIWYLVVNWRPPNGVLRPKGETIDGRLCIIYVMPGIVWFGTMGWWRDLVKRRPAMRAACLLSGLRPGRESFL